MLTIIEFLSPCMFSSTHSTSMSSRGAQHSIVSWFHVKPEAHQTELVYLGVKFTWWERRPYFLFLNSLKKTDC